MTLSEAKRLRAAGCRQGVSQMVWLIVGTVLCSRFEAEQFGYTPDDTLDAYNSDELIAAIQERWGDNEYHIIYSLTEKMLKISYIQQFPGCTNAQAPTLLSALVDLYCKLADND